MELYNKVLNKTIRGYFYEKNIKKITMFICGTDTYF